jgi:hypothetical protein
MAPTAPVAVYVDSAGCDAAFVDSVLSLSRVELGERLVTAPRSEPRCRIRLECAEQIVVISAVLDSRSPESQRADLVNTEESLRPRIVALAIAELVRDLERAPADPAPKPPAPDRPVVVVHETRAAQPPARPVSLRAFGAAYGFGLERWLAGGGLGFAYGAGKLFADLDVVFSTRGDDFSAGSTRTFLLNANPELGWQWSHAAISARLGAGFALGVASVAGTTTSSRVVSDSVTGAWGGPFAGGGVAYALADRVRLELRAQVGWVVFPVIGDVAEGSPVRLDHAWLGVTLGAAFSL